MRRGRNRGVARDCGEALRERGDVLDEDVVVL